MTSFKFKPAL